MDEQAVILFFLIIGTAATLFLYFWKAKKQIEYRGDERWEAVQNKANRVANFSNYLLIVFLIVVDAVVTHLDVQLTFSLNRVSIYAILFIAFRNILELSALQYFDRQL